MTCFDVGPLMSWYPLVQVGHQFTKGSELALNVIQGIKRRHFGKAGFIADTLQVRRQAWCLGICVFLLRYSVRVT